MLKLLLAVFTGSLMSFAACAQSVTFTTIDNPGDPTFNQLLGINDGGDIVGYFGDGQAGHPNTGYEIDPPYTSFKPFMQPGSVQTQPTGINNSHAITGFWSDTDNGSGDNFFALVRAAFNGHPYFLSAINPQTNAAPSISQVLAINDDGVAVGFYDDANGASHAYSYDVATATYAVIGISGASSSAAAGINDSGVVCGYFTNASTGHVVGFVKTASALIRVSEALSTTTKLLGINNAGIAVGFYLDANQVPHGLHYNVATGQRYVVNDPSGPLGTVLNGINNKGQIVGYYIDAADNTHGMLVNP